MAFFRALSTVSLISASLDSVFASNRSTRAGWVFEARTSPQPSGYSILTPSMSVTRPTPARAPFTVSVTLNLVSSGHSILISGVAKVSGSPASSSEALRPVFERISRNRSPA